MQLGVSTWEAAGFLGMSEKTLRVVYDHRIRCPVHTTSLIFGVAKFPQSSTNYADQFSDTSGESHRQRAPEYHSDLGSQNVCTACPYDTAVPAIVKWSSIMKLTPQRLHLKTLTSIRRASTEASGNLQPARTHSELSVNGYPIHDAQIADVLFGVAPAP